MRLILSPRVSRSALGGRGWCVEGSRESFFLAILKSRIAKAHMAFWFRLECAPLVGPSLCADWLQVRKQCRFFGRGFSGGIEDWRILPAEWIVSTKFRGLWIVQRVIGSGQVFPNFYDFPLGSRTSYVTQLLRSLALAPISMGSCEHPDLRVTSVSSFNFQTYLISIDR